jgi:hypothetical protein
VITLDLSGALLDLSGDPLPGDKPGVPLKMHQCVADALVKAPDPKASALKLYDLGSKLWHNPTIEVDESDFETIAAVVASAGIIPLVKAPIMRALKKAKEDHDTKPAAATATEASPEDESTFRRGKKPY